MKKWVAYLLSFYILFSALVPCSVFDACDSETEKSAARPSNETKDCTACPPFSICASGTGFTVSDETPVLSASATNLSPLYREYRFSFRAGFLSAFFQPPRTA